MDDEEGVVNPLVDKVGGGDGEEGRKSDSDEEDGNKPWDAESAVEECE